MNPTYKQELTQVLQKDKPSLIHYEGGKKDQIVTKTNRITSWLSVTHIFRKGWTSDGGDNKTFVQLQLIWLYQRKPRACKSTPETTEAIEAKFDVEMILGSHLMTLFNYGNGHCLTMGIWIKSFLSKLKNLNVHTLTVHGKSVERYKLGVASSFDLYFTNKKLCLA